MAIIKENWGELLEPWLFDVFTTFPEQRKLPDHVSKLFNVLTSKKAVETALGRGSIGMMQEWNATGRQVHYDDVAKGFKVTFTHRKYSNGLQIERDAIEDDQYNEIESLAQDLSYSAYYTRQYHGASVFNNAFNASYAGGDSMALCAENHPLVPGGSQTVTNAGSYDLTAANLETIRTAISGWKDDRGNIMPNDFDTLIVPAAKRKAALVIADTEGEPDSADNNVNVWNGAVNVIEWKMLTNPNVWFFVDSRRMKQDLLWFDKRVPKLERDGVFSFDMEVAKWKTVGRWSYGWKTPLWIYGNEATA